MKIAKTRKTSANLIVKIKKDAKFGKGKNGKKGTALQTSLY
ncbi:Uncharacterised protein [Haemophilus influenzae]|uniref:Uncharacterized protein n=1 Tax=Haemophilus influenzae TaxID=727 RepID=A0A2X1PQG2_HAEIF|nr:Uncharacterised protein [Haemophilus influenzae]